jgi:acetaldehyde dehydrogenase (acetylating)
MFYDNPSLFLARTGALLLAALVVLTSHAASLSSFTAPTGVRINGEAFGDETSRGINFIGDINGDGRSDIAIGAPLADPNSMDNAGKIYVVFGS